jgi:hypothetical protein
MTTWGPAPAAPVRARLPPPSRNPMLVRKSSFGTKERGDCFRTTNVRFAWVAISGAPPAPGRRVFGRA